MRLLLVFILCQCASNLHAQFWQQLPDFPGNPRDDASGFSIRINITAEQVATTDLIAREISIASTPHFKNGKILRPFRMAKIVNMLLDSHTTDWATFFAVTIAAGIS